MPPIGPPRQGHRMGVHGIPVAIKDIFESRRAITPKPCARHVRFHSPLAARQGAWHYRQHTFGRCGSARVSEPRSCATLDSFYGVIHDDEHGSGSFACPRWPPQCSFGSRGAHFLRVGAGRPARHLGRPSADDTSSATAFMRGRVSRTPRTTPKQFLQVSARMTQVKSCRLPSNRAHGGFHPASDLSKDFA